MSVLNENTIIGASAAGEYEIEQSLRFDEGRETRLIRTPTTNGSATTWTWSAWVKRSELSNAAQSTLFAAGVYNGSSTHLHFASDNTLHFYQYDSAYIFREESTQVFRDTSAWYHIVAVVDTTNGTAADRIKLYVNGVQITSFANVLNPNQNQATFMNLTANKHYIGDFDRSGDGDEFGGYLAEVNFIDGQALTPDSFGEEGVYGEWKPIAYAGTYGTNGFYLPFEQDYTVEGFSTVTYEGNGSGQYIGGVGFQPDLTWFKCRSDSSSSAINDSIRGRIPILTSNTTAAEVGGIASDDDLISWETDGFLLGHNDSANSHGRNNVNARTYVAWNWDMGGTTASNTDGSITSSVRANTTYGQSIVSYTGTNSNGATVGHGLTVAPEMVIVKRRNSTGGWYTYHASNTAAPETDYLFLDTTAATADALSVWNDVAPTASVITLGVSAGVNASGGTYIAYCFHSVTGYSKFGSYSGTGASGNAITTGFAPAFVMIKRTDTTGQWSMYDNTRNPYNGTTSANLWAESSEAEASSSAYLIDFSDTGFEIQNSHAARNASGGTYIYMAFADTREYAYWYDQSGNNNDWTSEGGLTESDVMVDSPTNNFATWNALFEGGESSSSIYANSTLSEGNLKASVPTNSYMGNTMRPQSGTWYSEFLVSTVTNEIGWGWINAPEYSSNNANAGIANKWGGYYHGYAPADLRVFDETSQLGSDIALTISNGDILQLAWDIDNNKGWIGINNTWYAADNGTDGNPSAGTNQTFTFAGTEAANLQPYVANGTGTAAFVANFGQDSSFAGNKTPQSNQDANGIGDFYYAPPTGFLALCTANLPEPDVIPSEHFNTVLYTGNGGTSQTVTGVGFPADFVWIKGRSIAAWHRLQNTVGGINKLLFSNDTSAEVTNEVNGHVSAVSSDGFNLADPDGNGGGVNGNGSTYVAWNWKAGGSAVSNTNGTITSSVSANPSAGFSIVSYTGTGANATVGHSLSQKPELMLFKNRTTAREWQVFAESEGAGEYGVLDSTAAFAASAIWQNTLPTSSVFSIGNFSGVNTNAENYIAYAFHSVDGYSKVGSYIGNGNADGPFVHCGFRPKFVMAKVSSAGGNWRMLDAVRSIDNPVGDTLYANNSIGEEVYDAYDFLSNGFKLKQTDGDVNGSGQTYIFIAFAETPFKFSNAR